MSQLIHGFPQAELDALRIPYKSRDKCLQYLVPFLRCYYKTNKSDILNNFACAQQSRDYYHCQHPQVKKKSLITAIQMRLNNPAKFDQDKVAPSLDSQYKPTIFAWKLKRE